MTQYETWRALVSDSEYLSSHDLEIGADPVELTIGDEASREEIVSEGGRREEVGYITFQDSPKKLALNAGNAKMIERIAGTIDPRRWAGVRIGLKRGESQLKGATVPAIKVVEPANWAPPKLRPRIKVPTLADVQNMISSGAANDQIRPLVAAMKKGGSPDYDAAVKAVQNREAERLAIPPNERK